MSRKTVKRRVSGIRPPRGSTASNRRLIPIQEESLKQWILSMDQCGMPPRVATVRQMANILAGWGGLLARYRIEEFCYLGPRRLSNHKLLT